MLFTWNLGDTQRCLTVAIRYVRQFREIFTEEGRRQVKITHTVPGRQPTVTYTQVLSSVASSASATSGSSGTAGAMSQSSSAVIQQVNLFNIM
jgi:transcription factor SPT20 homolog